MGQELSEGFRQAKGFVKKRVRQPKSVKGQAPLAFAVAPQEPRQLTLGEMITGIRHERIRRRI